MPHAKIGDLLQADDEVARWVLVLSLGRNDVALTKSKLEESFATGDRTALHWSRLLAGHLFEIAKFLRRSSERPRIREFTKTLPEEAQAGYKNLLAPDFLKGVLDSDRNLVFHYPTVDRRKVRDGGKALADALDRVKDLPMYFRPTYDESGGVSALRFDFADQVAVQFAATNFGLTDDEHRQAAARIKSYSEQLIGLADRAVLPSWGSEDLRSGRRMIQSRPIEVWLGFHPSTLRRRAGIRRRRPAQTVAFSYGCPRRGRL